MIKLCFIFAMLINSFMLNKEKNNAPTFDAITSFLDVVDKPSLEGATIFNKMEEEIFKECPSYEGYSISNYGTLISHRKRKVIGSGKGSIPFVDLNYKRIRKVSISKKGYYMAHLCINSKIIVRGVHVLVADAFIGKKPEGMLVRHLDGNPKNNYYKNLAYGTLQDNADDRMRHGHYYSGEKHHRAKLTNQQAQEIRVLRSQKVKIKELTRMFAVSVATIEGIIYNRTYVVKFEKLNSYNGK